MTPEMIRNTVKFVFPPGSPRPSWAEIAGFVKILQCNLEDMEAVYKMGADRSLCIKYRSEMAMQEAFRRNPETVNFRYSNGTSVELRMLTAGIELQYVRVFDVPPEVPDKDLSAALGKYGKIDRTVREKFPLDLGVGHLYNGVRGVYMVVERDIPPALDIGKWKAKVFYDGLKAKCFLCHMEGHQRNTCPTAKNLDKRIKINTQATYTGVADSGAAGIAGGTGTNDEEIIEVSEEEVIVNQEHTEGMEKETSTERTVTKTTFELNEEELKEIDQAAEQLGLENFRENIVKMSELIDQLPSSNGKDQASQRRAQFATAGSTERPKKAARKK